jgi:hypothetical protein
MGKIVYVKPEIMDLGAVTDAAGVSSCSGGNIATDTCTSFGTSAGGNCAAGESAGSCFGGGNSPVT